MVKQTWIEDFLLRSIKIIDIGYVTTIFLITAILVSVLTDKIYGNFDPKKYENVSTFRITMEMILHFWCYGIIFYIMRNIIVIIPFPLNGYLGFKHSELKEIRDLWLFGFIYLTYNFYMNDKMTYLYNRFMNKI